MPERTITHLEMCKKAFALEEASYNHMMDGNDSTARIIAARAKAVRIAIEIFFPEYEY